MRRQNQTVEEAYGSGFIDLFSNTIALLLFFLFIFVMFQFLLNYKLSTTTKQQASFEVLHKENLKKQQEIALLQNRINQLSSNMNNKESELTSYKDQIDKYNQVIASLEGKIIENDSLLNQENLTKTAMKGRIQELTNEISKLSIILENDRVEMLKRDVEIVELGKQLNRALANKTADLMEVRSQFFQELNSSIGSEEAIEKKGDRFVLQGELLFAPGSDNIGLNGKKELDKVATILKNIIQKIPENIDWIVRVDGHTDNVPLSKTNTRFKDNFDLSYARARAVVTYLTQKGVPAKYLVPTGFGEYQPLAPNDTPAHRKYNRRIEFQLTNP